MYLVVSLATGHTLASVLAQALVVREIFRTGLGLGLVTQLGEHLSNIWGALSLNLSTVKKGGTKEEGSQQVRPGLGELWTSVWRGLWEVPTSLQVFESLTKGVCVKTSGTQAGNSFNLRNHQSPLSFSRHRRKSSVSDSFSNLVHRPTMDQFTEGGASQMPFQAWALVAQRGEGRVEGRGRRGQERKVLHSRVPMEAEQWPGAFGGRDRTGEAQPPNNIIS